MTATMTQPRSRDIVIVGGGLAGLAAATVLAGLERRDGMTIRVIEGRRKVGGRAASFEDQSVGETVDACQHVALGCCTNFLDLCRITGIAGRFRRDRTLWFIGADNVRSACSASRWLPAPLHLLPLFAGMGHFSPAEKVSLAAGILRLARLGPRRTAADRDGEETVTQRWLVGIGQPARVIELFWRPVIESAVGESLELVVVSAARKVIVDGFLAHRDAVDLHVPTAPLGTILGDGLAGWLADRGVVFETGAHATTIARADDGRVAGVTVQRARGDGETLPCGDCVLAVPWRQAARLVPDVVGDDASRLAGSPITAVHLWFDRPVIDLPHAVLVGRLSQWVFCPYGDHYCQVVISASRSLEGMDRDAVVHRIVEELRAAFPAARDASLTSVRVVTDPTAVLSVRPGADRFRPGPRTAIEGLFLAGDWTATGWPSTMEGAVRSGRIAADSLLRGRGLAASSLSSDLPKNPLVRLLVG